IRLSLGSHVITLIVDDGRHGTASTDVTVVVRDTTPPALSAVADLTREAVGDSGTAVSWTDPTAADAVDQHPSVACPPASGSLFAIGVTTVACVATDASANTAQATFPVTVRDTTPPSLRDVPAPITREATSAAGATTTWTDPTATDIVDGHITVA